MSNQVRTAAILLAASSLASCWLLLAPAAQAHKPSEYDLAIAAGSDMRLEYANAAHTVAPTATRTLACVGILRLGFLDAGFRCIAPSAEMAARTFRRGLTATN